LRLRLTLGLLFSLSALGKPVGAEDGSKRLSDAQIKKILIQESIDAYPGNCPCPYNVARNGSSCGRRSAWSQQGGYAPLCYPADVTADMVREYRDTHEGR
jgi:hypothetical protein